MAGEGQEGFYASIGKEGAEYKDVGIDRISVTKEEEVQMKETYETVVVPEAEGIMKYLNNVEVQYTQVMGQLLSSGELKPFMAIIQPFTKVADLPTGSFESNPIIKERAGDYADHDFNNIAAGFVGYSSLISHMFGGYERMSDVPVNDQPKLVELLERWGSVWESYNLVARAVCVRLLNDYAVEKRTQEMDVQERTLLGKMFNVFERYTQGNKGSMDIPPTHVTDEARNFVVFGHEGTLANAGLNIMSNPIKKTKDIEATEFSYNAFVADDGDKRQLVQQFIDNGKGMDEARLANMFEKKPTEGAENSRGIGLAYVDNLIRSMGGRIVVDTIDRETGRRFRFDSDLPEGQRIQEVDRGAKSVDGTAITIYMPEAEQSQVE